MIANLPAAAQAGFQAGQGQGNENALGMFIRGMLQKHQQRQETEQEIGLKFGLEEFKSKLNAVQENKKMRQDALGRSYEIMTEYLKNADPNDENPLITAQALAARYLEQAGYPDESLLGAATPEKEPEGKVVQKKNILENLIPSDIPKSATGAEKVGGGIRTIGGSVLGELGKSPSKVAGAGAQGYNLLADIVGGATGTKQKKVPEDMLSVMTKGKLFDIPDALNFYKGKASETKDTLKTFIDKLRNRTNQ